MDMDDLLRQWDRMKDRKPEGMAPGGGKKANATRLEKAGDQAEGSSGKVQRNLPGTSSAGSGQSGADEDRKARDYLAHWLAIHGTRDKDDSDEREVDDRAEKIREAERLRKMKPQAVLDLHGRSAGEAEALLAEFLSLQQRRGSEKVLIIHGKGLHSKGEHVLTDLVKAQLERSPITGGFGPADKEYGGSGATWVRIRKRR